MFPAQGIECGLGLTRWPPWTLSSCTVVRMTVALSHSGWEHVKLLLFSGVFCCSTLFPSCHNWAGQTSSFGKSSHLNFGHHRKEQPRKIILSSTLVPVELWQIGLSALETSPSGSGLEFRHQAVSAPLLSPKRWCQSCEEAWTTPSSLTSDRHLTGCSFCCRHQQ